MQEIEIWKIADRPGWIEQAAAWFHEKWGVPIEAYRESMEKAVRKLFPVPQWYLACSGSQIIGGLGVIENDFHKRRDLSPNICAVYVEEAWRNRKIAGEMLRFVCRDMAEQGIDTLYLVTDHTSFYERYGWEFLCMVEEDDGNRIRMYMHKYGK